MRGNASGNPFDLPRQSRPSRTWLKSKNPSSDAVRRAREVQVHELSSINVRYARPVASRCLRIKLYTDENFS